MGLGGYKGRFNLPEDIIGKIETSYSDAQWENERQHKLKPPIQSKEMRTVSHRDRLSRRIFAFLCLEIFRIQLERS